MSTNYGIASQEKERRGGWLEICYRYIRIPVPEIMLISRVCVTESATGPMCGTYYLYLHIVMKPPFTV